MWLYPFKLLFDFLKKNYLVFALCICVIPFYTNVFSQQVDSLRFKLEAFDSLDFNNKKKIIHEYVNSDLNHNGVNLFILTYYQFLPLRDFDIYKRTFEKTSFSSDKLKKDSLFYLFIINLHDANVEHAKEIYDIMKNEGNDFLNFATKNFSDYYYDDDPKKSLEYYEKYFKFDALKYIHTKGESPSYWTNVDGYFRLLYNNQKYDVIITYCDSILPFKPNDERWLKRKAEAQYYLKNYVDASETYCRLYELENSFTYVQDLLRVYTKLGDTLAVTSLLSENVIRDEKDIDIRHLYYQYLSDFKLQKLKYALVDEVLDKTPDFYTTNVPSETFFYYSLFQFYNNQVDEAIKTLFRAIEMVDPTNQNYPYESQSFPPGFHSIFDYYVSDGNGTMFISKYYNSIGRLYYLKGKTKKAIKFFKIAIDYFDCNNSSNNSLAFIYQNSFWRSNKKAISYYEKIISCDLFGRTKYPAVSELGRYYYFKTHQPERAKELLLSAIPFGELKSRDYYILSLIYKDEKDYMESMNMLDKAIEIETEEPVIVQYNILKEEIQKLSEQK